MIYLITELWHLLTYLIPVSTRDLMIAISQVNIFWVIFMRVAREQKLLLVDIGALINMNIVEVF